MSDTTRNTTSGREMCVVKRDGRREAVDMNKITIRLLKLHGDYTAFAKRYNLDHPLRVDVAHIAAGVMSSVNDGISTSEIDALAAEWSEKVMIHPDYQLFAGIVRVDDLEKNTTQLCGGSMEFGKVLDHLQAHVHPATGKVTPLIHDDVVEVYRAHHQAIERALQFERNKMFDFKAIMTLIGGDSGGYLLGWQRAVHRNGADYLTVIPVETPQHMYMRVALGIFAKEVIRTGDISPVLALYESLSTKLFTMATPTMLYAGTRNPTLISCFLGKIPDSLEGQYDMLKNAALISRAAGGLGLDAHSVRSAGSYISGSNGYSNGIVPMLRVFDTTSCYVDQGGGKRRGAFAIYLAAHHSDLMDFLILRKAMGAEEQRARSLFTALWVSDEFLHRTQLHYTMGQPQVWSLFDPAEAPDLDSLYGEDYTRRYREYEAMGKYKSQVSMHAVWELIVSAWREGGTPYMVNGCQANRTSNQQPMPIRTSNLCAEIVEHTSADEVACCNLASMALPSFLRPREAWKRQDTGTTSGHPGFDTEAFMRAVDLAVRTLDMVIDTTMYPIKEAERSNLTRRPIGLGIQGLADVFTGLDMTFGDDDSKALNRHIAECMYFQAMKTSMEIATQKGTYIAFPGSPASRGVFKFDHFPGVTVSPHLDWAGLRSSVQTNGLRNSLLIACMPTASTSLFAGRYGGNTESFEPCTGVVHVRRTKINSFLCINRDFVRMMDARGLWQTRFLRNGMLHSDLVQKINERGGNIQGMPEVPEDIQRIFRGVYEISPGVLIGMEGDRAPFVCQSQSGNRYIRQSSVEESFKRAVAIILGAWKKGLTTLCYYTFFEQPKILPNVGPQSAEREVDEVANNAENPEPEPAVEVCSRFSGCESCQA